MTKVRINTPGVTVEIEADGTLDEVTDRALKTFHEAGGWPQPGPGPAVGFQAERRGTPPAQPSGMRWAPGPYPVQGQEIVSTAMIPPPLSAPPPPPPEPNTRRNP